MASPLSSETSPSSAPPRSLPEPRFHSLLAAEEPAEKAEELILDAPSPATPAPALSSSENGFSLPEKGIFELVMAAGTFSPAPAPAVEAAAGRWVPPAEEVVV